LRDNNLFTSNFNILLKYLLKISVFLLVYSAVLFAIYFQPYKYDNFFQSAELKADRLKKTEPQIILVGGSNTLFGIDSEMIVKATGYDVVNMGIHMGLGYYFQTNQIIKDLAKRDIVVLSPEYVSYFEDKQVNPRMLNQISEHYPSILWQFDKLNRPKLLYDHFLDKIKKNIIYIQEGKDYNLGPVGGYSYSGVNEYGDQTDHLSAEVGSELGRWNMRVYKGREFHPVFKAQTDKLIARCESIGCKVVFTFPAIARSAFDEGVANRVADEIDALGYVRMGQPSDYVFEPEEFYDTHYHPLKKARALRTQMLVEELKKII